MNRNELKSAHDAVKTYDYLLGIISLVKSGKNVKEEVNIGGPNICHGRFFIDKDLVLRMLTHAAARAKSVMENLGVDA